MRGAVVFEPTAIHAASCVGADVEHDSWEEWEEPTSERNTHRNTHPSHDRAVTLCHADRHPCKATVHEEQLIAGASRGVDLKAMWHTRIAPAAVRG